MTSVVIRHWCKLAGTEITAPRNKILILGIAMIYDKKPPRLTGRFCCIDPVQNINATETLAASIDTMAATK